MINNESICLKQSAFLDKEDFIKKILYSSVHIVSDKDFLEQGMNNKNIMFLLNYITEKIGSVSMLGSRNFGISLLGKIDNIINYYENIIQLFEKKEKSPTIPKNKKEYIRDCIKNSFLINKNDKEKYLKFIGNCNISDNEFIENLKLIYSSLVSSSYFENVSNNLRITLLDTQKTDYDKLSILADEYISLLIDHVGISIFEIKKVIRDSYRLFFEKKDEKVFINMLTNLEEKYKKENTYLLFIKMDKSFDEKLIASLVQSGNNEYLIYSKSGFSKKIDEEHINNQKNVKIIKEKYIDNSTDNNYFLHATISSKDIWHAIKTFKQKVVQPFIGSMLYSGIKVSTQNNKYIVIEYMDSKKFINEYTYHDDIFKPLSQNTINYSDVFKRYIIESNENEINKIIDEAVQLLPYYKNSDSILTKFTNTWFAMETLFRKSSDTIKSSLEDYASRLVVDRMISGYIYVTASQIKRVYANFQKLSNNFVENMFLNYEKYIYEKNDKCEYINWKYKKIIEIIDNYEEVFDKYLLETQELLDNAYRLRNKQFHGSKDSQLENMSGFLYDIVNDTISFYIDYLGVYKEEKINFQSLYNIIKNIKIIKSSIISNKTNYAEKISVLYDSIRKI